MNTPKKYGKGYKLFEMKDNKLYPLFIGKNEETKIKEWIPAEYKPTKGFASRGGWHVGMDIPDAPWLRGYDGSQLGPYRSRFVKGKRVWCEVFYDMTNDYRNEVSKLPKKCFVDKVPKNGFYWFDEGNRGTWIITSAIYVNRILSDNEVNIILKNKNYDPVKAYKFYKKTFEKRLLTNAKK